MLDVLVKHERSLIKLKNIVYSSLKDLDAPRHKQHGNPSKSPAACLAVKELTVNGEDVGVVAEPRSNPASASCRLPNSNLDLILSAIDSDPEYPPIPNGNCGPITEASCCSRSTLLN